LRPIYNFDRSGGRVLATFAVHLISVILGEAVSLALPIFWIQVLAGISFSFWFVDLARR
jgi:putative Ca2+/H+ antiporter (TMEM165/GDT1 family)